MKTSLAHLPEEKQDESRRGGMVRLTLEQFPEGVEMIIQFSSYARGQQVHPVR